jgi:hypothetical protein
MSYYQNKAVITVRTIEGRLQSSSAKDQARRISQLQLGRQKKQLMRVTRKGCSYKEQTFGSHILKRINIQAFVSIPVKTIHLKTVMNQCLSEHL